jgi:hypothetical protein
MTDLPERTAEPGEGPLPDLPEGAYAPRAKPLPAPSNVPHVVFRKRWAETVGFAMALGVTVAVIVAVLLLHG